MTFLTAIGCDSYGQRIIRESEELGMDISHALSVPDIETSTYVFLSGPDGEMELAVSDMRICERLTPAYFQKNLEMINRAELLVIDANLPEESIEFLTGNATVPVFADMVSTTKSEKFKPYLSRLHTIKPNKIEAQVLTGITINDDASLREAACRLLDMGVKNAYISLAENGLLAACAEGIWQVPACRSKVINVTGAGDAAVAALCYSYLLSKSPREAAMYANAASSVAIECEDTVSMLMSEEGLAMKIRENYI